ncbi:hypothetical protein [Sphingobacterium tabacisoli]|uniref:Lipopolysaccharide core biosynthesis protein rfaS n=1 Tax=Sphingobacterium tabacisoli TaxID=2044855 RepID=A0ABW5KXR2_9SPHI|nr:hypothetical protein [Sphingobacterium tabacisoli]
MFQGKKILLAVPDHVGFPEVFKRNLEHIGLEVFTLAAPPIDHFKYKNIFQRAHNFIRKKFFKDRDFKRKLFLEQNKHELIQKLNGVEKIDYTLFIRPDQYALEVVKMVRQKSEKMLCYQWDGLERYPNIYEYIPFMDRFFVFDTKDLSVENTLPLTNFFFDFFETNSIVNKNEVYYIGSYLEDRLELIGDIDQKLDILGIDRTIKIVSNRNRVIELINSKGLIPYPNTISYMENLKAVVNATVLIDIQNPIHNGLSFRIFEGLGYDKKIITTNTDVIKYDFYHPNNILVWDNQTKEDLSSFLSLPYQVLPKHVKNKYSFTNWFSYITEEKPYEAIDLPS